MFFPGEWFPVLESLSGGVSPFAFDKFQYLHMIQDKFCVATFLRKLTYIQANARARAAN